MAENTDEGLRSLVASESRSALDTIIREGARKMLEAALQVEVADYIDRHASEVDACGHRLVVRNGHMPSREIQTGAGSIPVRQPRVNDRRPGHKFSSMILPPYMRRSPGIEDLIPLLYLKGVSTSSFPEALSALLGPQASGLSPSTISRLKDAWSGEYEEWSSRSLSGKRYIYLWADGVYFNVRLSTERPCMLVIIGTLSDGTKELVAIHDGERESKLSWLEVMRDLKRRGLKEAPFLAVGDGALGFWSALEEEFPETRHQRCWVHKMANVLDKLPKSAQANAKSLLRDMHKADTKKEALEALDDFVDLYEAKHPRAVKCLLNDRDSLFTFYDFPANHWRHIRTTNPIESTFATVRHRHRQTRGCGSRKATLAMVYMLAMSAERHWRKISKHELLRKVIDGVRFVDGNEKKVA